jgi:tetratricopeptide (TPR) repeat protein
MSRRTRSLGTAAGFAAAAALLATAVVGVVGTGGTSHGAVSTATTPPAGSAAAGSPPVAPAVDGLTRSIEMTQATLRSSPTDYRAWATLGLDYVQQAKVTVNPAYYPKATGALATSLRLHRAGNYVAMAGEAALHAAEHRFRAARRWAQRGLRINPDNATLYGALDDADTQLGHYGPAFAAVRRMNALQPGIPSFTRAEYVYELRGDIGSAQRILHTALAQADQPSDEAFIDYYLGELAFNSGRFAAALRDNVAGLTADPTYYALLEGKAKAEAALGRDAAAVRDYLTVVSDVPQPEYVVEAGELLQSLGQTQQAQQEYALFGTENKLFESNGVTLDTDPTLFYADHGRPKLALHYGRIGIRIRPFIEMDDAYAWALHVNHRNRAALRYEHRAMRLGTRNALFDFHAGMIERSLGRTGPASRHLHRALAINPAFNPLLAPVAHRVLSRLGGAT